MKKKDGALPVYEFKKDVYRKRRGGKTKLVDIYCSACGTLVLVYQKDMPRGLLKRCYVDRIFYPEKFVKRKKDRSTSLGEMSKLECMNCKKVIGTPMEYQKHGEDRLAYNMIRGSFVKKSSTHGIGKDR